MDSLKSLLPKVLRKRGLHDHAKASLIVHLANQWMQSSFGPFAQTLHAQTFERGTLVIAAESSVAAQEMALQESALKSAMQQQGHSIEQVRIVRR